MVLIKTLQRIVLLLSFCAIVMGIMPMGKIFYSVLGMIALMLWLAVTLLADIFKAEIKQIKKIKINLSFIKAPLMRAIARLF